MKHLIGAALLVAASSPVFSQEVPSSEQIWRSDHFQHPEAVYIPAGSEWAYIGNQVATSEDEPITHEAYISRLNILTGEFESHWASHLDGPLGMTSFGNTLYAVDNGTHITALDLTTGEVIQTWTSPADDVFFNDLAVDDDGRLYVTDSRSGALLRLENDRFETLFDGDAFASANGVEFVDGSLYVVCSGGVGNLIRIDPATLQWEILISGAGSLDGVVTDGRGGLVLSDIPGRLLHWSEVTGLTVLDGFESEDIMLNSIGGTADGTYIFAPHWRQSQVSAFRMTYPDE
jgi:outer membrane protein assembly factor BamB